MNRYIGCALLALVSSQAWAAEAPRVLELRTQKVDDITYFHLRIQPPADMKLPSFNTNKPFSEGDRRHFARLPQLLPVTGKTRAVYYRYKPSDTGLGFYGQTSSEEKASFRLLYPLAPAVKAEALPDIVRSPGMAETTLEVDFAKAVKVPLVKVDPSDQHISRDDLRSNWALYQAAHFAVLETQVLEFNFYSFAREATARKYGIIGPAWVKRRAADPQHRLYEVTTGADAIAETLQIHRLGHPDAGDKGPRTIDVAKVAGVTVAEQPWQRLLGGKKPTLEPSARLVPDDNYYVHFKSLRKFIECGELLDQWGTSILRVYEMKSRDCQLQERYEKQLCLKSSQLAKTLGPALVKSVAITGSDPYVREGTDVTVIFHLANRPLFTAAVARHLEEARQEHGQRLREGREEYQGVTIETFVTPLREVSLHRASIDDFIIYANSPAGVRRVIDTHKGRRRSIADASDFKYMRTVFPLDDKDEDGFVFLSDAFIRQLVGPAGRIKEKRRLEAMTSLYMMNNAALFTAWETGKLPTDQRAALAGAGLKADDVAVPEGKPITWDPQQLAVSEAYNTLLFATPLIELPIDKITPAEEKEYNRFRDDYSRLWQRYFDPIAVRIGLDDKQVRVKTHILPVVNSEAYRELRQLSRAGKIPFQAPPGVFDFRLNFNFFVQGWIALHVGESDLTHAMVELLLRWESAPGTDLRAEYEKLFWKLPITLALNLEHEKGKLTDDLVAALPKEWGVGESRVQRYKGVDITSVPISAEKYRQVAAPSNNSNPSAPFATILALIPTQEAPLALHVATIDNGVHLSAHEDGLKRLIDHAETRKKAGAKEELPEINTALAINPGMARKAAGLFLEYEGHCLALLNNQVWSCFYQCGVLPPDSTDAVREATVRRYLGHLPVSPDGAGYAYDPGHAEVVNRRHGSFRQPRLHLELDEASELGRFLNQVKGIRAEMRLQDEGLHATLTIDRQ